MLAPACGAGSFNLEQEAQLRPHTAVMSRLDHSGSGLHLSCPRSARRRSALARGPPLRQESSQRESCGSGAVQPRNRGEALNSGARARQEPPVDTADRTVPPGAPDSADRTLHFRSSESKHSWRPPTLRDLASLRLPPNHARTVVRGPSAQRPVDLLTEGAIQRRPILGGLTADPPHLSNCGRTGGSRQLDSHYEVVV